MVSIISCTCLPGRDVYNFFIGKAKTYQTCKVKALNILRKTIVSLKDCSTALLKTPVSCIIEHNMLQYSTEVRIFTYLLRPC